MTRILCDKHIYSPGFNFNLKELCFQKYHVISQSALTQASQLVRWLQCETVACNCLKYFILIDRKSLARNCRSFYYWMAVLHKIAKACHALAAAIEVMAQRKGRE